jgi:hypothetical protein
MYHYHAPTFLSPGALLYCFNLRFYWGMKLSGFRYAWLVTVAALAACGGNTGNTAVPAAGANAPSQPFTGRNHEPIGKLIAMTTAAHIVPVVHRNRSKSWISSAAKHTQYLLYVSDQSAGTVDVYAYKSQKGHLVGQLTGFQFPYGECHDGSGNVYITDFAANAVLEYPHGGTNPVKTIDDSYGYPIGCAVNPKNGDVAVANWESSGTGLPGVVIYPGGTGNGTNYIDQDFIYLYPPGYDPNGNLYVQGQTASGNSGLAMLGAGASQLGTLSLSGGTIYFPGGVQWDGKYIAATDQSYLGGTTSAVYRISVSGSAATIVTAVELTDSECMKGSVAYNDVVQPYIGGTNRPNHAIVGGNLYCDYRLNIWNYRRGGDPKRVISYPIAPQLTYGHTISPMKR